MKNFNFFVFLFLFYVFVGNESLDQFELIDLSDHHINLDSIKSKPVLTILVEKIHCFECVKQLLFALKNHSEVETYNILIVYQGEETVLDRKFFITKFKRYVFNNINFAFTRSSQNNNIFAYFQMKGSPSILVFNKETLNLIELFPYTRLFDERGVLRPKVIDTVFSVILKKKG